ncbi:MAG: hypothetical protein KDN20_01905 [Verrucomicrobiae bacterium]|nr:hypothetical protein [Verrucomicrobiae bacterium]
MLPEVEKLVVIQDRDLKTAAIQKELKQLPLEEDDAREKLASDTRALAAAKLAAQENEVAMKNLELDIQTRQDSIAKLKVQQFETRKNEEFRAMGDEIEKYQKSIIDLEDRELVLMEKGEQLKKQLSAAEAGLASSQELVDEDLAAIQSRRENLNRELKELEAQRAEKAATVAPEVIDVYNRLFKSKGGLVVVPLEDGQCKGCHMKVIKSTVVSVKMEKELTHCENCGRILYWWTEE